MSQNFVIIRATGYDTEGETEDFDEMRKRRQRRGSFGTTFSEEPEVGLGDRRGFGCDRGVIEVGLGMIEGWPLVYYIRPGTEKDTQKPLDDMHVLFHLQRSAPGPHLFYCV